MPKADGQSLELVDQGLVLRTESGFCTILTSTGKTVSVNLAKKMKAGGRTSTTVVVTGDHVVVRLKPEAESGGMVESLLDRRNELVRLAPGRKAMKDVLAANLDTLIVVHSLRQPAFNASRLDRFLAIAEQGEIPATVVLNKHDLARAGEAEGIAATYKQIGYPVVIASAKSGEGIDELRKALRGICAIVGPSGAGKSTLMNHIYPGLNLRTQEISESTGKGKHTTVTSELLQVGDDTYVADTPGLRSIGLVEIDRYEVASLFKEMQPLIGLCRFADCQHIEEPGCAIKTAIEDGRLCEERYQSYRRLLSDVCDGFLQDWES